MASLTCDRAEGFCRQLMTSSVFTFCSSSLATFLISLRSSVVSSGAGRVRMSKQLFVGQIFTDVPLFFVIDRAR